MSSGRVPNAARTTADTATSGTRSDLPTPHEIGSILDLRAHGESTCGHVIELLEQHLKDLDLHMKRLRRARRNLTELTERARGLDPTDCTDSNRCQTIAELSAEKRDLHRAAQQMYEVHGHRHG